MAYASWSVVFGEQPSAAKWNILGTNDASFNDGSGIAGFNVGNLTTYANPYKFRARRTAALTLGGSTSQKVPFDTEDYDSNNNFDSTSGSKGRYTVPFAGFYQFNTVVNATASSVGFVTLQKNGSPYQRGQQSTSGAWTYADIIQATTSDYFEIYVFYDGGGAVAVAGETQAFFSGFLVSRT